MDYALAGKKEATANGDSDEQEAYGVIMQKLEKVVADKLAAERQAQEAEQKRILEEQRIKQAAVNLQQTILPDIAALYLIIYLFKNGGIDPETNKALPDNYCSLNGSFNATYVKAIDVAFDAITKVKDVFEKINALSVAELKNLASAVKEPVKAVVDNINLVANKIDNGKWCGTVSDLKNEYKQLLAKAWQLAQKVSATFNANLKSLE